MRGHPLKFGSLLFAACLYFSKSSTAQHMNAAGGPCQGPASMFEETQCFVRASKTADERLNKIYNRVREVLSPEQQKDLQEAQRLWLKFRDRNCSGEQNLYAGGSAAAAVYAACIEADTRQRADELKTMYSWRLEKVGKTAE